jgi:hypothetical protein
VTAQPNCGAIAVVEDPFVSKFLRSLLLRRGYRVIDAKPEHCVDLLRSGEAGIGLVITNIPAAFAEFADRVPLLYLAAFPDLTAVAPFRSMRVLRKPFLHSDLLSCVEELVRAL